MFKDLLRTPAKLLFLLIFFFYVFDVNFNFVPITTSVGIGMIGVVALIAFMLTENIRVESKSVKAVWLLFLLVLCLLISVIYNQSTDFSFLFKEIFRNNILVFSGAFLMTLMCSRWEISARDGLKCFIFVSALQSVITIISFIVPPVGESLRSIQSFNDRIANVLGDGIRAFGLGAGFDRGSFIMSFLLIITCYLYVSCGEDEKKGKYIFLYILQAFAGLLMARSIVTGVAFSLLYILLIPRKKFVAFKFVLKLVLTIASFVALVMVFFPNVLEKYQGTIVWLTEFFNTEKIAATGKTTNTLDTLFNHMYFVPEKTSTWVIGDGYYLNQHGSPYKNVDPCYMRYLLLFGVTGTAVFLIFIITLAFILRSDESDYFGEDKEHKTAYDLMLVFFVLEQLLIYVKLDFHFYFIVYFMLWLEFFNKKKFPVNYEALMERLTAGNIF